MTPPDRNSSYGRYGTVAIRLHWLAALLVVVAGTLGLFLDSWPKATKVFWINIHAMIGLAVFLLILVRLWWRSRHAPPPLPSGAGELSVRISGPVHLLLYGLLIAIPIIGLVTFAWHGRVLDFGLFRLDPGIKSNPAVYHPMEHLHGYLAYALFALAGAHAAAALWHHFIRRDAVLLRMWPPLKP